MTQLVAYAAYAVGSSIFLSVALSRGSLLLALASGLFLVGTLLLLVPSVRQLEPNRLRGPRERGLWGE